MPAVRLPRPIPALPLVCVVTGQRDGVALHEVRLTRSTVPFILLGLGLCGPIGGALAALVTANPLVVWLPLSDEGQQHVARLQFVRKASLIGSIVLVIAAAIGPTGNGIPFPPAYAYATYAALVLMPVGVWLAFVRRKGPELLSEESDAVTLWFPSEEAAKAVTG